MVLYFIAYWLLLNMSKATTSSSKECYGPDYTETYPFYGIPTDICIHAVFNSSVTKSLEITLSYGSIVYGKETFSDHDPSYNEKYICDPKFPAPLEFVHACSICLGFDDVFLSDNWARICPKYILSCKNKFGKSIKQDFPEPCFTVGEDDNDDIAQIVGGNTDFTFKLLSTNALTKDIVTDVFFSPFSIANSLVMLMMAANGETLKQLMSVFELTKDDYNIFDSYDTLIQSLQHDTNHLQNDVSNKLWINTAWSKIISPQYLKDFDRFGSIESCNFKNDSIGETQKIDDEIKRLTRDIIEHPLENKILSSQTVMLFTNTMYLNAKWKYKFTTNISEIFTDDFKEKITIEMMVTDNIETINKYNDSQVEIIELPFDDDFSDISFIIIRPTQQKYLIDGPTSTIQFEKYLNKTLLSKWLNSLTETAYNAKIMLPFLEMYNLETITESLQSIGIIDVFDKTKSDLTNLTTKHYKVYEGNINRQDYMKITPNGIEIASVVTDGSTDGDETNQGPVKHADLPFLFLIIDRSVNLILYGGRVTNPKGWIIYNKPNNNSNSNTHSTKLGTIILLMILVIIFSYLIIKYFYNRTVMKLNGLQAIPHINQCIKCKNFCNEKIE
eukprot:521903_1